MAQVPVTPDTRGADPPTGRRARKRLETRQALADAAVTLFTEHGFEAVTVTDIAERADVDASTFFRHFGSKEAVLFTDWLDFTQNVGEVLDQRPAEEPLFDAMVGTLLELGSRRSPDVRMEVLRARLAHSSPVLRTQALVYRERLVDELALAIARRIGADPVQDAYPYLTATLWASALDFYRRSVIFRPGAPTPPAKPYPELLADVLGILRLVWRDDPPATGPGTPSRP